MAITAQELQQFYQSPIGQKLAAECLQGFQAFKAPSLNDRVMGFGYVAPYFAAFADKAAYCQTFMPELLRDPTKNTPKAPHARPEETKAEQKSDNLLWVKEAQQAVSVPSWLPAEHKFPLKDDSIDCILAIHALEFSPNSQAMLRELWRVLAPNGRLILAIANRRGFWAHAEYTPFGHGQPYSYGQLAEALKEACFAFHHIKEYVHFLPNKKQRLTFSSKIFEKLTKLFFPYFGSVLIVEATKKLYNPLVEPTKRQKAAIIPKLIPQPSHLKPQNYHNKEQQN